MDKNKRLNNSNENRNAKNVRGRWITSKEKFGTLIDVLVGFGATKNSLTSVKTMFRYSISQISNFRLTIPFDIFIKESDQKNNPNSPLLLSSK